MSSTTSTSTATSNAAVSAAAAGGDQDDETTTNLHVRRDWYSTVATFISGGVAGAASRTLTAPLDRVKTIVQEGHLVPSTPQHQNLTSWKNAKLLDVARLIRADGGWRAFWRGNMVNCLKAGPEFAIVFSLRRYFSSLYEEGLEEEQRRSKAASARWKERLEVEKRERAQRESLTGIVEEVEELTPAERVAARRRFMDEESALFPPPLHHLSLHHIPRLMVNCTIGAAAGIGAQSILYPMEVVKTRVCVSRSNEIRGGVRDIITDAYRAGGIQEFYKGFAPNLVGIFVYRGLEMGIYSSLQQSLILYRMQWKHLSRHDASLSTAEVGGVGMFASMIAQTVSYPLNVVRTKLQTQGSNGRQKQYNGMVDCFTQIVRRKGVCALFSGLMANYLKALPASACTFIVFEKVQQVLVGDD